jgi:hypothetical protein
MKLFESQWESTKTALLEGKDLTHNMDGSVNNTKKRVMETLLDNQRKALMEAAASGVTSSAQIAQLNKVILPVMRRVMPTVIANEIVGVQPMTGPIAQIHTMRVRYAESYAGATAGDEMFSPKNIAKYYSGDNGTDDSDPVTAGTQTTGSAGAAATTALEGYPGRKISIQTLRQIVEAKSRKLSASWTFEAAQDAQAQQGIDIEEEIMAALAQEITSEIDQEILAHLRALAGTVGSGSQGATTLTFDQNAATGTPTFIGDVHAGLAIQINRAANLIASRTRRGSGNWCVVSPTALTILQSAQTSAFARSTEGAFEAPTNTKYVGTLNGIMKVFVDAYATDATDVLVGYKGSETDAAAFYCPYVPLMSSGVVMDPDTMQPVVSFMTRYGYVELASTASSLGNAADYVQKIGINAANLTWQ